MLGWDLPEGELLSRREIPALPPGQARRSGRESHLFSLMKGKACPGCMPGFHAGRNAGIFRRIKSGNPAGKAAYYSYEIERLSRLDARLPRRAERRDLLRL